MTAPGVPCTRIGSLLLVKLYFLKGVDTHPGLSDGPSGGECESFKDPDTSTDHPCIVTECVEWELLKPFKRREVGTAKAAILHAVALHLQEQGQGPLRVQNFYYYKHQSRSRCLEENLHEQPGTVTDSINLSAGQLPHLIQENHAPLRRPKLDARGSP